MKAYYLVTFALGLVLPSWSLGQAASKDVPPPVEVQSSSKIPTVSNRHANRGEVASSSPTASRKEGKAVDTTSESTPGLEPLQRVYRVKPTYGHIDTLYKARVQSASPERKPDPFAVRQPDEKSQKQPLTPASVPSSRKD
jgi:hypothetical protein